MFLKKMTSFCLAAVVGATLCAAPIESASAFTLASPSLAQSNAYSPIEKAFWRHGGGWRGGGWRGGWGWGPGAVLGGLAAGALVGSAIYGSGYYGPGYGYGPGYYGYDGPCWRRFYDPYAGWQWQRVC